jgi:hypothetical protein
VRHALTTGTALATAVLLTAPAARGATVSVEGTALTVRAAPGEDNTVLVERTGAMVFRVTDDGPAPTAGAGCGLSDPRSVVCAGLVTAATADLGDGDDAFSAIGLPLPVTASGGEGADLLVGGLEPDTLDGGPGDDGVSGSQGDDTLDGDAGDDLLAGDTGADTVRGGDGADIADGGRSSGDRVDGGTGADLVKGGPGDDRVDGGPGDDALSPAGGDDVLITGSGTDQVFLPADGQSTVRCRPGDQVRAPEPLIPDACTRLSPTVPVPDVWPPPARPRATAAFFRVKVVGRPMNRGRARSLAVVVETGGASRLVSVELRLYGRTGAPLKTLRRRLWSESRLSVRIAKRYRSTYAVKGRRAPR